MISGGDISYRGYIIRAGKSGVGIIVPEMRNLTDRTLIAPELHIENADSANSAKKIIDGWVDNAA